MVSIGIVHGSLDIGNIIFDDQVCWSNTTAYIITTQCDIIIKRVANSVFIKIQTSVFVWLTFSYT